MRPPSNLKSLLTLLDRYVLDLEPEFPLPHVNRGIAYAQTGQPAEAIADFEEFLALIPEDDGDREMIEG